MTIPAGEVAVPERVRLLAGGDRLEAVWHNELGGLTFRATGAAGARYIKYGPRNPETSMVQEAERLAWAGRWIRVPRVLDHGGDETHEWLVTAAIDAESAVSPRWLRDPATAVRAVGEGLRALHETLPVDQCPFDWSVDARIANAEARGIDVPADLHTPPPVDRLVVCHADACCPNTLVDHDGRCAGHVDLGALGTGERWADIAVASMSTAWNYGPGWEDALIDAYGLTPDRDCLDYYRRLWNAT